MLRSRTSRRMSPFLDFRQQKCAGPLPASTSSLDTPLRRSWFAWRAKLKCATCDRLKSPQVPPPSAAPSTVTQFGDRVELDIFYVRKLDGENVMVLGFHQAAVLTGRTPEIAYEAFERVWLRPYGLPTLVAADPDGCFQGDFQNCLESHGTLVEHCPPDAHWKIAHVERQCLSPRSSRSWWTPFLRPRRLRWTCSSLPRSTPSTVWCSAGQVSFSSGFRESAPTSRRPLHG